MRELFKALSALLLGAGVLLVGCILAVSNDALSQARKPVAGSPLPADRSATLTQLPTK